MKFNMSHKTRDVKADFIEGKPVFREAISEWREARLDGIIEADTIEQYFEEACLDGTGYEIQPVGTWKKTSVSSCMGFIQHEYTVFRVE